MLVYTWHWTKSRWNAIIIIVVVVVVVVVVNEYDTRLSLNVRKRYDIKNQSYLIWILKTIHRVYCYSLKTSISLKYLQNVSSYLTENELHCHHNDQSVIDFAFNDRQLLCYIKNARARVFGNICLNGICIYHSLLHGYVQCDIVRWHINCKYSGHGWHCRQIGQHCVPPRPHCLSVFSVVGSWKPLQLIQHRCLLAGLCETYFWLLPRCISLFIPRWKDYQNHNHSHPSSSLLISKLLWHYDPANNNLLNNPYIFYFTCS